DGPSPAAEQKAADAMAAVSDRIEALAARLESGG
ncbi:MAG TPA: cell division protein ZapA, partial [Hyphomonas adhaerens]|nr:cell division protein ZapA [Hyphomonas adhaerens]